SRPAVPRRGHRDRGAAGLPDRPRLPARAGVPLRQADAGGRLRGPSGRPESHRGVARDTDPGTTAHRQGRRWYRARRDTFSSMGGAVDHRGARDRVRRRRDRDLTGHVPAAVVPDAHRVRLRHPRPPPSSAPRRAPVGHRRAARDHRLRGRALAAQAAAAAAHALDGVAVPLAPRWRVTRYRPDGPGKRGIMPIEGGMGGPKVRLWGRWWLGLCAAALVVAASGPAGAADAASRPAAQASAGAISVLAPGAEPAGTA